VEQILEPFAMVGPFETVDEESAPLATTSLESPPAAEEVAVIEESADYEVADAVPNARQLAEASALNRWWLDEDSTPAESEHDAVIVKAEVVETEVAASEVAEIEVAEIVVAECEVAESEVAEIEVAEIEVAESEVAQIEVAESEVAEIVVTETEVAEIEVAESEIAEIVVAESEIAEIEVAESEIAEAITELAADEPVDVETEVAAADIEVVAENVESSVVDAAELVGSAPLIATITDAYSPYDIAQRDLELEFLPLSTVQPIKSKIYVTLSDSADVNAPSEQTVEVVASEPAIDASPDCLLDEMIHKAAELAEQTRIRDLTFAAIGESIGDLFVALAPAPQPLPTMLVDGEVIPAPVADDIPNTEVAEEIAAVEIVTPEVTEIAVAEVVTMEVDGEVVPAPIADDIPNTEVAEEIAAVEVVTPEVSEIAVAEVVTMEVDGEVIPAPVADDAPNAGSEEPVLVAEVTVPETTEVAAVDVAAPAATETASVVAADDLSISKMLAAISKWQKQAITEILADSESASVAPTAEIAEKADETNESVVR
jgi:hypothetical protein